MNSAAAWALYYAGDAVSRLPDWMRWYRLYNWLMVTSGDIQGDGSGPWSAAPQPDTKEE
jgi:hypothetical protein